MKRILLTLTPFSRFFFCFIFQETAGSNVSHKTDSPCANSQVIPALWFQSLWILLRFFFQFEQVTQVKGGIISESFSIWLQTPKKCGKSRFLRSISTEDVLDSFLHQLCLDGRTYVYDGYCCGATKTSPSLNPLATFHRISPNTKTQ